jgi:hypothetical protein
LLSTLIFRVEIVLLRRSPFLAPRLFDVVRRFFLFAINRACLEASL